MPDGQFLLTYEVPEMSSPAAGDVQAGMPDQVLERHGLQP